ncbi:MAG: AMP-binding protein, partial [Acidimicrobiales bacterium]
MTPTTHRTIPELVADAAQRYGDLEALVDGDVTITYADLRGEVDRAARGLMALGVVHGDRVAIWAPNCWEWVIIALGAHVAGGVVVPINTRFKAAETEYVLRTSGAKVLATVTDFLDSDYVARLRDRPEPLSTSVPALERIVVLRGHVPDDALSFADVVAGGDSVSENALAQRTAGIGPDDLCHIMFTSGTTGS